jgi:hypothetical protein
MSDTRIHTTLATWVYVLHADGMEASDTEVRRACEAVAAAADEVAGEAAGAVLIQAVASHCSSDAPADVLAAASALYGDRASATLGQGDRDACVKAIRRYQFEHGLPWMARVWERRGDGTVTPGWVIVERVTDAVMAMDPDPWDGIDEERVFALGDFFALWELDGSPSVHLG